MTNEVFSDKYQGGKDFMISPGYFDGSLLPSKRSNGSIDFTYQIGNKKRMKTLDYSIQRSGSLAISGSGWDAFVRDVSLQPGDVVTLYKDNESYEIEWGNC